MEDGPKKRIKETWTGNQNPQGLQLKLIIQMYFKNITIDIFVNIHG